MQENNFIESINSLGIEDVYRENDDTWIIHTKAKRLYELVKFLRQKSGSRLLNIVYDGIDSRKLYYVFLLPSFVDRKIVKIAISDGEITSKPINSLYPFSEILERKAELTSDLVFEKTHYSYVITEDEENKTDAKSHFSLRLIVNDGIVDRASLYLGSVYGEIESRIKGYRWAEVPIKLESMFFLCPFSHQLAYTKALEKIAPLQELPEGMSLLRIFFLEHERLRRHLLWIGMIADFVGNLNFLKRAFEVGNKSSPIIRNLKKQRLSHYGALLSSTKFEFPEKLRKTIAEDVEDLEKEIHELFEDDSYQQVIQLVKNIGELSREEIDSLDPVGPTARALGLRIDMREMLRHEGYDILPVKIAVNDENDVAGLVKVRMEETKNSALLLQVLLEKIPKEFPGNWRIPSNCEPEYMRTVKRSRQSLGMVEAPGGLLTYHLITNPYGRVSVADIVTPTMRNLPVLLQRMKGEKISHIALLLRTLEMSDLIKTIFIHDISRRKTASYSIHELSELGKKAFEKQRKQ